MTGDRPKLTHIIPRNGGYAIFDDSEKHKIVNEGKASEDPNPTIDNVLLVDGLKRNLLSISQFCDKNCKVVFKPLRCVICDINDHVLFQGLRHDNI